MTTALAVSGSAIKEAYDELKEDVLINLVITGHFIRGNLSPVLARNDLLRAAEIVSDPISADSDDPAQFHMESILVVDKALRVIVSSHPQRFPALTELRQLSPKYALLAERIAALGEHKSKAIELPDAKYYYYVTPIFSGHDQLGTLIIVHPQDIFMRRFVHIAWHGLLAAATILAILLPISWYWGRRIALPLVQLTARMGEIGRKWSTELNPGLYAYDDELGRLFKAYNQMLNDLREKESLEVQMVQSERLAALGQLAAGIAHEINNPLSGMLTAIDTLKCYSDLDPRTLKTIALIVRGLNQIKDTVGALLVEAKINSRNLAPQDIEDVLTLVTPMARKKSLHIGWHNSLDEEIPLPATLVRQVLINLLLNAVQAAAQQGEVDFDIGIAGSQLRVSVANNGKMLSAEQIAHLFEPFSPLSEGGHGLGLWVTYQIVQQLGGHISVKRESNNQMNFGVSIPLGGVA